MPKGFLPNSDSDLRNWCLNFSQQINSDPAEYGISPAQAAQFATLLTNYETALEACEPNIRNKVSVAIKNTARQALKTSARMLARIVYATASVSDAQKLALGLNVRSAPSPIAAPTESPGIRVASMMGNIVTIQLFDRLVTRIGKPPGVDGACCFIFVGETAPTSLAQWQFAGITSRTSVAIDLPGSVPPGSRVWFTAQWFNTRKQPGPLANPISTNVMGATVRLAA